LGRDGAHHEVRQRYGVQTIMQCITANRGSETWG
jgi:hypothetical protein